MHRKSHTYLFFCCFFDCVILKCFFYFPVTWLKDGKAVDTSSSMYTFEQDKKKFKFSIKKCTASDVGQYTAKAEGKKGETVAAFALNVCSPADL